jgi:hypothetical protein
VIDELEPGADYEEVAEEQNNEQQPGFAFLIHAMVILPAGLWRCCASNRHQNF